MKRSKVISRVAGMALVLLVSSGFTGTPDMAPKHETVTAVEVVNVSGGTLANV